MAAGIGRDELRKLTVQQAISRGGNGRRRSLSWLRGCVSRAGLHGGTRAPAGTADTRIPVSRRVFERMVRFLYAKKKVFVILGLQVRAGRLWPPPS
jgi:hypothetical protein